jgi:cell division protein FtsZ
VNRFKPIKLYSVAGQRKSGAPRIGIAAVGSAAGAMLQRLAGKFPDLYRAIEIDTEGEGASAYDVCADQTIVIGEECEKPTLPSQARAMALAHEATIEEALKPLDLVFILAGMGGATGSGVAPLVAAIAKRTGVLAVGVAITPFAFEDALRIANASSGIEDFRQCIDTLFTLDNECMFQGANEGVTEQIDAAFLSLYGTIRQALRGGGTVGGDFEDVQEVFYKPGRAAMGFATGSGDDRIEQSVMRAVEHPSLGSDALGRASEVLVLIRSGEGHLTVKDAAKANNLVRAHTSRDGNLYYMANVDPSLGKTFAVSILATGIPNHEWRATYRGKYMKIEVVCGNVVNQPDAEALVNSANANLRLGSGVAGAIHTAAGPALEEFCKPFAPLGLGQALVTPGFGLPNPWVIHVRAASYINHEEPEKVLEDALEAMMAAAHERGIASLAMPAIGTGVFRFPPIRAACITAQVLQRHAEQDGSVQWVRICVASPEMLGLYAAVLGT